MERLSVRVNEGKKKEKDDEDKRRNMKSDRATRQTHRQTEGRWENVWFGRGDVQSSAEFLTR